MGAYQRRGAQPRDRLWDALRVRALRRHLRLTQRQFAEELNARQQTVSEWETDRYRPRGPSARLLSLIAEAAGFAYETRPEGAADGPAEAGDPPAGPGRA